MSLNSEYLKIGHDIIQAAFEVRRVAGKGMRERFYQHAMAYELRERGYDVKSEVLIPALYKGIVIDGSYEADLIVDNRVILELKSISVMREYDGRQLLSYLKLSDFKLGYLINFGTKDFSIGKFNDPIPYTKGIYRFVNGI